MTLVEIMNENKDFLKGTPHVFFSPGRVNLIGEHIDFLGGNVFPTAIDLGTYAFVTKREDKEFHFLSQNFKQHGKKIVSLDHLEYNEERNWANYPTGMIEAFIKKGMEVTHGLNVLIYGTLPNGAGLSSSASLEVLMGTVLKDEYDFDIEMFDIVQIAQKVENKYIGVNCGIMDQFAVGMSRKDTALFLNTNTLEFKRVPLLLGDYSLVIANTNKRRSLADSKYNERRQQCETGLKLIQEEGFSVTHLCDLSSSDYQLIQNRLERGPVKKRVEHAIYENERTKKAVEALEDNDLISFGKLMNLSHDSLRDLYEVSCEELDILVDSFRRHGAVGSRMTGAGFGGCTISLVASDMVDDIIKEVSKEYKEKVGYNASFYSCKTTDGARRLQEEEVK